MMESSDLHVSTSFPWVFSSASRALARSTSSSLVVSMVRRTSRSHRASVRTMVSSVTSSPKSSAPNIASIAVASSCLYMVTARAASVARAKASSL